MTRVLTFSQLPPEEQEAAVQNDLKELVEMAVAGFKFGPDIDAGILMARTMCEKWHTPWFFGQYVIQFVGDSLTQVARTAAEQAVYVPRTEPLSSYRPKC